MVSVLIPSFNHQKYIISCLESVKASDYDNLELLLLDDGSDDRTYHLASEWMAENSDRFVHARCARQDNAGICETLNRLAASAKGQYITGLASDDQLLPHGITSQVAFAMERAVKLVLSDAELIDEDGALVHPGTLAYFGKSAAVLERVSLLHLDILLNWNPPYQHQFIEKSYFDAVGGYRTDYVIEDLDFCLTALLDSNIALCPRATWRYRIRVNNRVTPGLERNAILADVRSIFEHHLPRAKGLEKRVLRALVAENRNKNWFPDYEMLSSGLVIGLIRSLLRGLYFLARRMKPGQNQRR